MNTNAANAISEDVIELRQYTLKPGRRDELSEHVTRIRIRHLKDFRMPLHADAERRAWKLRCLDKAIGSNGTGDERRSERFDPLMVHRIDRDAVAREHVT